MAWHGSELAETSALVFGRRSYEAFASVWPGSEDHVAYRDLPKYVVSSTLQPEGLVEGWGEQHILRGTEDVAALKQSEGGALFIHGSGELALRLAEAGLVDRYNLLVFPVLLGEGKSVFSRVQREQRLSLRESAGYANGVLKAVYDVVR